MDKQIIDLSGRINNEPISRVYNIDCIEAMKQIPDNYFQLSLVDPPYGIGASNDSRFGKFFTVHLNGKKTKYPAKDYKKSEWDNNIPDDLYFSELKRVSKNQIIWGGNYYNLGKTNCYLVWDKRNGESNNSDCELAWTSFDTAVRMFSYKWNGMLQQDMKNKEDRIHPTQKPVQLYKWLLKNYAKEGDKILDTHLGSGSSRIACYDGGFDFVGCELDKDYFDASVKRFEIFKSQLTLF